VRVCRGNGTGGTSATRMKRWPSSAVYTGCTAWKLPQGSAMCSSTHHEAMAHVHHQTTRVASASLIVHMALSAKPALRAACGSAACGRAACGSAACGRAACGSAVCGRATCGCTACGRAACGSAVCGRAACGRAAGAPRWCAVGHHPSPITHHPPSVAGHRQQPRERQCRGAHQLVLGRSATGLHREWGTIAPRWLAKMTRCTHVQWLRHSAPQRQLQPTGALSWQ
jgi:hypothetical protein